LLRIAILRLRASAESLLFVSSFDTAMSKSVAKVAIQSVMRIYSKRL
jgi:hypothetical protein